MELEVDRMTEYEQCRAAMFTNPQFQQNQSRFAPLAHQSYVEYRLCLSQIADRFDVAHS